jgi:hypothetical protein
MITIKWERQILTNYADLIEEEKEYYRAEARKALDIWDEVFNSTEAQAECDKRNKEREELKNDNM